MKSMKKSGGCCVLCLFAATLPALTAAEAQSTRYVDAARGDDTNDGATAATAWRTLQHAADSAPEGATVHMRAGMYRETVRPRSGQTFQAYENEKPLITGCDPVSGWTRHSGNIYKATVKAKVLDVFANGDYMQIARWPNEDGDPLTCGEWVTASRPVTA